MQKIKNTLTRKAAERAETLKNIKKNEPAIILSTWFGCGYIFPAPGFWGTLGSMPLGVALLVTSPFIALPIATFIIFFIGLWAAKKFEMQSKTHDSSMIVIDETAGILLTLMFALPNALSVTLAFILFRIFDSIKPWPISWIDRRIDGALGVMIDDIFAGLAAGICLVLLRYYGGIG